jgi:pimeloyl-ACP methyl ester carboxylesterase
VPHVQANNIEIYYEVQGAGEPLVLIPYLAADQACYAFQVADYATRFTCYTVDLRGAGLSGKPDGEYTTELLADDVAAFMHAAGIGSAHVFGLSLGAATGMWLAAKHPSLVKSLSLHSAWDATDPYLRTVVQGWQTMATGLDSTTEMVIQGVFPWCFTPSCTRRSRSTSTRWPTSSAAGRCRRSTPSCVSPARSSGTTRPACSAASRRRARSLSARDVVTSTRFAGPLTEGIKDSELVVFEGCAHAPIYENIAEFNAKTIGFLLRQAAEGR